MLQMKKNKNKVIAVVGATASGKSAYAIDLAKEIDGEIVSADSRLVYKDMNIGTAKPTEKEMAANSHYMIDIVEPDFDYSAGLYVQDAKKCINNIIAKGKCMSAGIIILLSVPLEQRIATSSTTFMIHQASSIAIGKTADMEDDVKEAKRLNEIMFNIIKNNTAITQEDLDKNYDRKADWMLTAKEALKLKLISKII